MLSHYVIIRRDLPAGLQLAYSVHAAGESVRETVPEGTRAVVLAVENAEALLVYERLLGDAGVSHRAIVEDGTAYAIGLEPVEDVAPVRRLLSGLPLA